MIIIFVLFLIERYYNSHQSNINIFFRSFHQFNFINLDLSISNEVSNKYINALNFPFFLLVQFLLLQMRKFHKLKLKTISRSSRSRSFRPSPSRTRTTSREDHHRRRYSPSRTRTTSREDHHRRSYSRYHYRSRSRSRSSRLSRRSQQHSRSPDRRRSTTISNIFSKYRLINI